VSQDENAYTPLTGATPDGVPLARNRLPATDLMPWVSRVMAALADAPVDAMSTGYLCNDAGYIRTAIGADWTTKTADGLLPLRDESFICGQHTQAMELTYRGPVIVAGIMLKPGAMRAIWGIDDGALIDRIKPMALAGIDDRALTGLYTRGMSADSWLEAIEGWLRHEIATRQPAKPDYLAQRLEQAAFADPNIAPGEFCAREGVLPRQLQRVCKRSFGMSPKHVLRRARVLDLAARMCGVADAQEEEEFMLRYFDQSHLIRDFSEFFGGTPRQFMANRQPLLTLSLEIRQARRLELLDRIAPDAVRPWMRQEFAPPLRRTA